MDKKKIILIISLFLLIILASCSSKSSATDVKQKVRDLNKVAENAVYHATYSFIQGNKSADMEVWQKKNKLKSKLIGVVNNEKLTSISTINDEGVFVCQSKGDTPIVCMKPKEIQDKYSKGTVQAFRDELLEKLDLKQTEDKTLAGEKSQCFLANLKDKFQEICYTDKGIMTYTKQNTKGEVIEITAKSIDYSVEDSKFKLEGELLER